MTPDLVAHKIEMKVHNTAPVRIPGLKYPFRKIYFKMWS